MDKLSTFTSSSDYQDKCDSASMEAFNSKTDEQASNGENIKKQKSFDVSTFNQVPQRRLQKSLTDQSGNSSYQWDSEPRQNFHKSHTCGSLYAKCNCSEILLPNFNNCLKLTAQNDVNFNYGEQFIPKNQCQSAQCIQYNNSNNRSRSLRKLHQSYCHPDTPFVFTDENKNPTLGSGFKQDTSIRTKGGKLEIKYPKRLSSPNIGNYTVLDIAVHPEVLLKVSTKSELQNKSKLENKSKQPLQKNKLVCGRSDEEYMSTDSENSVDIISSANSSSASGGDNFESSEFCQCYQNKILVSPKNSKSYKGAECCTVLSSCDSRQWKADEIDPAQKFFQESGILGPVSISSSNIVPQTSKGKDITLIDKIRKNSKMLRNPIDIRKKAVNEVNNIDELIGNLKFGSDQENHNDKISELEEQVRNFKDVIKDRDNEICKLKREIHKLKSVLQQTTNQMPIADGELLSSIQAYHGMAGQNPQEDYVNSVLGSQNGISKINSNLADTLNNFPVVVSSKCLGSHVSGKDIGSSHQLLTVPVTKKQGVSGESCDVANHVSNNIPIPKYEKDFESKQLIKDAIMDNDFLKNIDSSQVRELVESMYSLDVLEGEYVIREGEAGAHLYVSAEGTFEVIKNGVVLGLMGPGKAFGELAILYNCTRTASIRVLSHARVWVLDRRVFQQIMMRTGMQRIEDSINFLKSVPLLKNLTNDILTKIADVLEVEFYSAGTYIIRQGTRGDTFFLIRQGSVKVTQKVRLCTEEKEIRILSRGDYFGEQALINEDKRTANIIALPPGVECLTLDRESFTHLIGNLCELKEKQYGDINKCLSTECCQDDTKKVFGADVKQELLDVKFSDLEVVTTLGIGGFGRVELVKCHRNDKLETFALKCLKKKHIIDTRQEEHVYSERTIMLSCNSPFICRLYRTFRDDKYIYMLLEACMGGEVWTLLRDRGNFGPNTAQFIIGCVIQAFEYLHDRGIIYRDLKPENLMLNEKGYVKLVDFGFAKYIGHSNKTWTFCGTPEYVAPEIILNKGHDRAVDYWALGILIHELLTGAPPFTANDPMKTYNIILKGIDMLDFPKYMSRSAIMLIKKLCRDVPAERLGYQKGGIQDIKKHKWFQGFDWDGLANLTLIPPFLRPVTHPLDTSYFDTFTEDTNPPPDELSGWDADF